jgi:flagella basal body P-ring formation protein FlgA
MTMSENTSIKAKKYKSMSIFIACAVLTLSLFCQASVDLTNNDLHKDSGLKIYLPREVTIKNSNLTLGRVSIIQGSESLTAKANEIPLGKISLPGQKIVLDRPTILGRLACNGIPTSKVTLTGSEKITIKQQNRTISGDDIVSLAESFLEKNPPDSTVCKWNPIRKPKDFVVSEGSKDIKLFPRLVRTGVKNQARVEIAVLSESKKIGARQATFSLVHECHQAITEVDIPAGGVISPQNIKIEKIQSNDPEPAGWKPPYGLIAKRPLPAGTVLVSNMLKSLESPVILKRNQNVVIRIETPGFLVTAMGIALQDGRAGDYIKVRNMDSQRIILARIKKDGTVEPGV